MPGLFLFCAVLGVFSQEVLLSQAGVRLKKISNKTLKSWFNPEDGVLATENTPVYGMRKKETPEGTPTEYEFVEYLNGMKEVVDYLRATKPDIIVESTYNSSLNEEESSSESPTIVYPEVLVIIDYDFYQKFNYTFYDAIEYTLAFWTGVDIEFRSFEQPKVRLNIAGILLIEHPDAIPYVNISGNRKYGYDSLHTVGEWLYKYKAFLPIESYDFAVVHTQKILAMNDFTYDSSGFSNEDDVCNVNNRTKVVNKLALFSNSDNLYKMYYFFDYILDMFYLDVSTGDTKSCNEYNNLSDRWAHCKFPKVAENIRKRKYDCIGNKPKEGKPVPRILLGKLISLDQQCNFFEENSHGDITDLNCGMLLCRTKVRNEYKWARRGAALGSPCGDGKICLLRECVEERFIY